MPMQRYPSAASKVGLVIGPMDSRSIARRDRPFLSILKANNGFPGAPKCPPLLVALIKYLWSQIVIAGVLGAFLEAHDDAL